MTLEKKNVHWEKIFTLEKQLIILEKTLLGSLVCWSCGPPGPLVLLVLWSSSPLVLWSCGALVPGPLSSCPPPPPPPLSLLLLLLLLLY